MNELEKKIITIIVTAILSILSTLGLTNCQSFKKASFECFGVECNIEKK